MQVSCNLDIYIVECTHHRYSYNQLWLILLASCILVACDNYITTKINVTHPINDHLQLVYGFDTLDHATCILFSPPIRYATFNCLQLVVDYDSHWYN
jgi:hypothetical protein